MRTSSEKQTNKITQNDHVSYKSLSVVFYYLIALNPRNKIVQTKNNDTILGNLRVLILQVSNKPYGGSFHR